MRTHHPKKTLVSSKYQQECCPRPRTTCWSKRNDSHNVCSALNAHLGDSDSDSACADFCSSNDDDEEPRKLTIFSRSKPPHKICKTRCRSCYCNDPPVRPLLCYDEKNHCGCPIPEGPPWKNPSDEVHSVFLKYTHPAIKRAVAEKHTKWRRNYDNHTANYFVDLKTQLAKLEEEMKSEEGDRHSSRTRSRKSNACRSKSAEDLQQFRLSNFFDCHASGVELDQPVPEHRCQHDFTLDEQLHPVPKNPDVFGVSRCKTCSKPSSSHLMTLRSLTANRSSDASINSSSIPSSSSKSTIFTPKRLVYNVGLESYGIDIPKKFCNGMGKSLKVPCYVKPPPTNSMALMFQKGIY